MAHKEHFHVLNPIVLFVCASVSVVGQRRQQCERAVTFADLIGLELDARGNTLSCQLRDIPITLVTAERFVQCCFLNLLVVCTMTLIMLR